MHQQSYSETNYFEIEGEDSMIAPNGGENEILLNLFIFILFHKLVYFTTRMYPITSFKCKMYKEIVKIMISLMTTLSSQTCVIKSASWQRMYACLFL